ncbi:PepSY domain-containing protein [Microbacterium sp. STN6]|uniref:PepSY domain-containing protein n=1 Tax=Microbacterium sp. STN6 TaxID=2995588 RepID=UPI002260F60F|nr:PepSY domain-containing protein [Microbacterium sp. STN6]MCX7522111.1 PepSY domain-containing protein [Microbacterium sp. STN6]
MLRTSRAVTISAVALALSAALVGCTGPAQTPRDTPMSSGGATSNGTWNGGPVNRDQAGQIAVSKYGGTVKNIDSDTFQAAEVWEVELQNSNEGRIEVKISKTNGSILKTEKDG